MTDPREQWMNEVIQYETPLSKQDLIVMINFRTGYALGLAMKNKELEDKLDLALDYQRELDARVAERRNPGQGAPDLYKSGFTDASRWIAKDIRETK